jgi:hypothetical protein
MKLYRNAVILVVIVALLGAAYYFVNKSKSAENGADTGNDLIKLTDYTTDKIASVTIVNSEGTMVIVKEGTDWKLSSPTDFKADPSKLSGIVINISSVTADKVIEENAADLAKYGLDRAVLATVKLTDGTEKTIEVGGQTPTKDAYYAKLKDAPKVYTISTYTAEQLLQKKKDIMDKAILALKSEDIIALSMDRKGQNLFKSSKTDATNWSMTSPIQGSVNASALEPMLAAVATVTALEFDDIESPNLADYGLDNPPYVFEFQTSTANYKLLLGKEKVKGSQIYAKLDGSKEVFTLDETPFNFLDKPLKEIVDVFAYIVNIDSVTRIDLTMDGKTTVMGLDVYKDAEGKMDSDKDKFTVDGKDASGKDKDDKQPFRNFYQALIGISLDDIDLTGVPTGTPEVSIKYYLKTSPGTMQVDFISKDANYYYVMRNGKYANIVVRKDKKDFGVAGMKESYQTLMDFLAQQK